MLRRRRRERSPSQSSDSSKSSIGVRSHEDPSIAARRQRMGMRENIFDRCEEEDDEEKERESSSSTVTPEAEDPDKRPVGAPRNYTEEVKMEDL
eukprot:8640725-Karenia_brevis.AAC.1